METLIQIFDYKNVVYIFWAPAILIGLVGGGSVLIGYEYWKIWKGGE